MIRERHRYYRKLGLMVKRLHISLGKKGVPESKEVIELELLGEHEHYPAEGVEMGVHAFVVEVGVELRVVRHQEHVERVYFGLNSVFRLIQTFDEVVLDFAHQDGEAEEAFVLVVVLLEDLLVLQEGVVQGRQDLVHA